MKFYFCGSMTFDRSKLYDYQKMIAKLKEFGSVLNEFVGEEKMKDTLPLDEFNQDVANLKIADMLVADITVPSTGVGFEIGYFLRENKPMLLLYEQDKPLPSSLVRGIEKSLVLSYKDIDDALVKIAEFVRNAK